MGSQGGGQTGGRAGKRTEPSVARCRSPSLTPLTPLGGRGQCRSDQRASEPMRHQPQPHPCHSPGCARPAGAVGRAAAGGTAGSWGARLRAGRTFGHGREQRRGLDHHQPQGNARGMCRIGAYLRTHMHMHCISAPTTQAPTHVRVHGRTCAKGDAWLQHDVDGCRVLRVQRGP